MPRSHPSGVPGGLGFRYLVRVAKPRGEEDRRGSLRDKSAVDIDEKDRSYRVRVRLIRKMIQRSKKLA